MAMGGGRESLRERDGERSKVGSPFISTNTVMIALWVNRYCLKRQSGIDLRALKRVEKKERKKRLSVFLKERRTFNRLSQQG